MDYENIRVETDAEAGWAQITIAREKALNALNGDVLMELSHAIAELELEGRARAVIVTGAGKAFVAGADIAAMRDMGPREALAFSELGGQLGHSIETSPMAFIAAVDGYALGGGCELAMCCDLICAGPKAVFGQPEVALGVIPGFGGTQRLARRVGFGKAKDLCLTGARIDAEEALRIGLADRLVTDGDLLEYCRDVARTIAGNGPVAVAEAKRVINEGLSMSLPDAVRLEQLAFANLFATGDQSEGMEAFLAKRKATFEGR